jgi:glycosyltransferase involved in cell wall biosynthesis
MGTTKYKIAYFQQDGLITGSALSLRHFLSAINRDVFEPVVILAKEGPARDLYESLNIKVLVHNYPTFWTFPGPRCFSRGMFHQLKALFPNPKLRTFVLNEIKPDLIHINDKAALNVGISLKHLGIPIVQHSRSSYFITECKFGKYLSAKTIKAFSNHIICISEDEEDGFENFTNKSTIYNTVDVDLTQKAQAKRNETRQQLKIKDNEYLIGFAAHVSEKKGAWDFLELCKQLKKHPTLKFLLAGQIDEQGSTYLGKDEILPMSPKAYVESFIKENNLENQLIVTGFRKDILDLIASMDVLVVPNKNGVLGRQPIEAQALGVSVIAKAGHSNRSKVIEHGVTGYLVQNIAESVEQLGNWMNSNEAKKMAQSAMIHAVQNFTPATNMRKIESIYLNLIKH